MKPLKAIAMLLLACGCMHTHVHAKAPVDHERFNDMIATLSLAYDVDPLLVKAIIHTESGFRPKARSNKNAIGLMQVIPDTARRFGVTPSASTPIAQMLEDPFSNLLAGIRFLDYLNRKFEGNLPLMLAAYNAGENAVIRHGYAIPPYNETRRYVKGVLQRYNSLNRQDYPEQRLALEGY
ncbi:lytic transglycosylase domain-containing protein [Pseudomonas fontis]|uniref:Lytic transglycosylase domain-containing protein n=1 Tax=Pseudomonas fontis TaxID=2942633 RepID=A0ABT5NQ31_9PSED|nr:lytic transglycosylase domain-containing protein [Pseudomonas fontis]MDD0990287.1 lytic transglycosylase domain-containing protein [Pseudomonas fontis]